MRRTVLLGLAFTWVACQGDKAGLDEDGDGFGAEEDCDDADPSVNPAADETWYDGVDQDCDGADDFDADADGYASDVYDGEDCDDADATLVRNSVATLALGISTECGGMSVTARRYGEQADAGAPSMSGAGDTNGDGFADVLLGQSWVSGAASHGGAVYLELGPVTGDQSLAEADAQIYGVDEEEPVYSARGIGDTDADGYDDLIVRDQYSLDIETQAIYVFVGPVLGELTTLDYDGVWLPSSAMGMVGGGSGGDINGDGWADLVYLRHDNEFTSDGMGIAYGPLVGEHTIEEESARVLSDIDGDLCFALPAEDTNGDGVDDLIAGCVADASVGLLLGPLEGDVRLSEGEATFELHDQLVGTLGDVNGDGLADLLMSSDYAEPGDDGMRGASFVYHSPVTGWHDPYADADAKLIGANYDDDASWSSGAGDLDGDGLNDIQVSASGYDDGNQTGRAHLVLSPVEGAMVLDTAWWTVLSSLVGTNPGQTSAIGDTDDDGYDDLLLSMRGETAFEYKDGTFFLLHGGAS